MLTFEEVPGPHGLTGGTLDPRVRQQWRDSQRLLARTRWLWQCTVPRRWIAIDRLRRRMTPDDRSLDPALSAHVDEQLEDRATLSIPAGGSGNPTEMIPLRVYFPRQKHGAVIVYFHGGGFFAGSIEQVDPICAYLAAQAKVQVVSVGYRLAPEHPFPAAVEDAVAASLWAHERYAKPSTMPLYLAGDSAGGNLAAVTTQLLNEEHRGLAAGQILFYPSTDYTTLRTPSYDLVPQNRPFKRAARRFYLPDSRNAADPRCSPLRADRVHPPARSLVVSAEFDALRSEGEAYAERLSNAGGHVTLRRYNGLMHGFLGQLGTLEQARDALARAVEFCTSEAAGTSAD